MSPNVCSSKLKYSYSRINLRILNYIAVKLLSLYRVYVFDLFSSTNKILHQSKVLCLPHPKILQKLVTRVSFSNAWLETSIGYLNTKSKALKSHELLVNLHIDKIYIQQELNFKGGSLHGLGEFNPSKIGKTAQVIMISSLLSKYKDVVSICASL